MSHASDGPEICVQGLNMIQSAAPLWHFMQGHLLESFKLLVDNGIYARNLRLTFPRLAFRSWDRFLSFYSALFDVPPRVGKCTAESRKLRLPPFNIDLVRHYPEAEFGRAVAYGNSSFHQSCAVLPQLHKAAATVRQARPRGRRPMRMVFIRRTGHRSIENGAAVEEQLRNVSAAHQWAFFAGHFEDMPPLQQVDLMLETDILISYHGSG
jgi:hypothetical protein